MFEWLEYSAIAVWVGGVALRLSLHVGIARRRPLNCGRAFFNARFALARLFLGYQL